MLSSSLSKNQFYFGMIQYIGKIIILTKSFISVKYFSILYDKTKYFKILTLYKLN
jgi:hypothetical protein